MVINAFEVTFKGSNPVATSVRMERVNNLDFSNVHAKSSRRGENEKNKQDKYFIMRFDISSHTYEGELREGPGGQSVLRGDDLYDSMTAYYASHREGPDGSMKKT